VAWVRNKGVLPIVGCSKWEQLQYHHAGLAVSLSDEQIRKLDASMGIDLGYPHALNNSAEQREVMTGGRFDRIDYPTRVVA
jgi:hypothetical protein